MGNETTDESLHVGRSLSEKEIRINLDDYFALKLRRAPEPKYEFVRAIGNKIIKVNSGPFNDTVLKYL